MKKILVLLVAVCSLFVACSKDDVESSHSLDGTKWHWVKIQEGSDIESVPTNNTFLIFNDGYAALSTNPASTTSYKVKGSKVIFESNLSSFSTEAELSPDKSSIKLLSGVILKDGSWKSNKEYYSTPEHSYPDQYWIFSRVVE